MGTRNDFKKTEHVMNMLLDFFKLFGQKERLALAGLLILEPLTVPELSRRTGLKEMEVLRHLNLLLEMGLLGRDEERFWFDESRLNEINREVWTAARPAATLPKNSDEEIVQRFVRDGRIIDLPLKQSSLILVMRWLATQIPADHTYSEREISDLLAQYHEDYASLRRYLVDFGLMARDHGRYWLLAEEV